MSPLFRFRSVLEELEAVLLPPNDRRGADGRGKAERKRYATGEQRLKVIARDLAVANGRPVQVFIEGRVVAEVVARKGRVKLEMDQQVPAASPGQTIELRAKLERLLVGEFVSE